MASNSHSNLQLFKYSKATADMINDFNNSVSGVSQRPSLDALSMAPSHMSSIMMSNLNSANSIKSSTNVMNEVDLIQRVGNMLYIQNQITTARVA